MESEPHRASGNFVLCTRNCPCRPAAAKLNTRSKAGKFFRKGITFKDKRNNSMTSLTHFEKLRTRFPDAWLLLVLLASVHLLFGRTVQAGFVTDFTGLQNRLNGAPFLDFLTCFGFPAMHQVTNFFLYIFYKFFGTNGLCWYLIFTSLHVANGFRGYQLGKKIFANAGHRNPHTAACIGCLLFVFSPYQAEPVAWKVCFNFLFCSLTMLGCLWHSLLFLENGNRKHLLWSHCWFFVALFTFELAVATPLLLFLLMFWWQGQGLTFARKLKALLMPQALFLAAYFLLNKLVLGSWVGHYGEGVHLSFNLREMTANALKYFFKYLLFWREWSHESKGALMHFLEKPAVAYGFWVLVALLLAVFLKKKTKRTGTPGLWWSMFFAAILPVSNLYVMWLLQGENDRYGYLASLFFFMGLASLLVRLPRVVVLPVFVAWLSASVFFLYRMTGNWQQSAQVYYSLLDDFRWENVPEVYVLAFPENYRGLQLFKDFSKKDRVLKDALRYSASKETAGKFYQVAQFNMTTPEDGVSVEVSDSTHLTVTFNQWGNWWWRNGIGTGDYETERYRFKVAGNGYQLELKQPVEQVVFIFTVGGKWQEVEDF
jgi:hypothetical protein